MPIYLNLSEVYQESIEALFTKTEMNNERNLNFLQNSPLYIQQPYSSEDSIIQNTFETFLSIWYEIASFNVLLILKSYSPRSTWLRIRWLYSQQRSKTPKKGILTVNWRLVVKLLRSGKVECLFLVTIPRYILPGLVGSVRIPSMSQIDLFKIFKFNRNTWCHITVNYSCQELLLETIIIYEGLLWVTWKHICMETNVYH